MDELVLTVASQEVKLYRFGLKRWMDLERLSEAVYEAARNGRASETAESIYRYLHAASGLTPEFWRGLAWFDVALVFVESLRLNACRTDIPILKGDASRGEPVLWDYDQRDFYAIAHMLASAYGWSLIEIENMDVNDAFPLLQEILLDEQFEREWEWQMSEIAYQYDKTTKKSMFKPLPRPNWMLPQQPKVTTYRSNLLPVGNVVDLSGILKNETRL